MKEGKLIVQPIGGLANRMRVLAFAKQVTDIYHADLKCLWSVNEELYAPLETLFVTKGLEVENVFGKQRQVFKSKKWWKNIPVLVWLKLNGINVWLSYDHVCEMVSKGTTEERETLTLLIGNALKDGKTVYLATGEYMGNYTDISFLEPTGEINQKVNKSLSAFDAGHRYGLHIRRTDNTWAIEHSPIELFESKIEEIIKQDKKAKFYLATDDIETANLLKTKYGDHIVYRDKELSRTSENGIKEAVIDMWMLGNMDVIYGSYWSSFSEVAGWINHKQVVALNNNE